MTDAPRAQAKALYHQLSAVNKYQFARDVDGDIDLIAKALAAARQAVWEECATQADKGVFVWSDVNKGKADALAEFADYCRQQAQDMGGGDE